MLTTINVLNSDLADLTPETPANTGQGKDAAAFQTRLGEAMDSPTQADPPHPVSENGEHLPSSGNNLPVDMQVSLAEPVNPALLDDLAIIDLERAGDAVASDAQFEVVDYDVDSSIIANPHGHIAGQLVDVIANGPVRGYMDTTARPGYVPVFDAGSTNISSGQLGAQGIDSTTRDAAASRLALFEANENARQIVSAAANSLQSLADKTDGLRRKVNAAGSQPGLTAVDSLAPLPGSSPAIRAATAPPIQASINIPVLDAAWGEALNERVLWMAGKSIQKAEIRLNPAELGPIRVEVSMVDDAAKISFNAQHAVTREAIEAAMPRLREMLSENGISLANTDVSDAGVQHDQLAGENDVPLRTTVDATGSEETEVAMTSSLDSRSSSALVDTFV